MKTGMELLKELRKDGENLSGDAFLTNQANADLLQAWLGEWSDEIGRELRFNVVLPPHMTGEEVKWATFILKKLLGTTQEGSS